MIQTLDLGDVVEYRRRRELGAPRQRPIERGECVVVLPIGGLAFAVEPLEKVFSRAFAIH